MRRVLTVVGLLALVAIGARVTPARAATPTLPSSDPFYTYSGSTPLAQIAPGAVLRVRPIQMVIEGAPTPYSAQQVLYRTTGELGQPTATVATIIKPASPVGATKLISYQTFYDALGSECDPSYTLQGGNPSYSDAQDDAALMQDYLQAGYTVVTADYEGENLDWAAGQESGYNTLDGIRAAENALGVSPSTQVGMVGYSGGSIATEWASELAPAYAPELNIVGVAEGGIPVDYAHNLTYINGDNDGWAGVIPAVLVGVSRAYGINLDTYLSAYGQQVIGQVADECINNFAGSYPGLTVQQLLKPQYQNFLAIPTFASIINSLIMGSAPGDPTEPLFMGVGNSDGTGDGVMVAADVEALAHEYCQQGVPVEFTEYQNLDHEESIAPFESGALCVPAGAVLRVRAGQRMRIDRGRQLPRSPERACGHRRARLSRRGLPAGHRQAQRQHPRTGPPWDDARAGARGLHPQLGPPRALSGLLLPDPDRGACRLPQPEIASDASTRQTQGFPRPSVVGIDLERLLRRGWRPGGHENQGCPQAPEAGEAVPHRLEPLVPGAKRQVHRSARSPARDRRGSRDRRPGVHPNSRGRSRVPQELRMSTRNEAPAVAR